MRARASSVQAAGRRKHPHVAIEAHSELDGCIRLGAYIDVKSRIATLSTESYI